MSEKSAFRSCGRDSIRRYGRTIVSFSLRKRKFRFEDSWVIFVVLTLESTWNIVRKSTGSR